MPDESYAHRLINTSSDGWQCDAETMRAGEMCVCVFGGGGACTD